jgi:hypothetical protein
VLFGDAALFYAALATDLDEWGRADFTRADLRGFARERRRLLHVLLDRALDLVELLAIAEGRPWP